jgi:hypothetical protein
MKKIYLISSVFFLVHTFAHGQYLTYTRYELLRQGGLQANVKTIDNQYDDIKGEAYFSPQWLPAQIATVHGQSYIGIKLKLDLYANKLYTMIHDTVYDLSSSPIARFEVYPNFPDTLSKSVFGKGFSTGDIKSDQFVQVLADGKLTLLKQQLLQIKDIHDDSFLSTTKKFVGTDHYYILKKDGQGESIRLNKNTLERQTADKWKEVSQYIKVKDISASTEEGWASAIAYYNTL